MKKILVATLIIASFSAQCQVNFGVQAITSASVGISFSYLSKNAVLSLGYKTSFISAITPSIVSANFGYQINLSNWDEDNYCVTPSFGVAHYAVKKLLPKNGVEQISSFHPIYSIELGKDLYLGRFIATINYCNGFYAGVGIKAYLR